MLSNNITDINCVGDKYTNGYTHIIIYDKLFYNFVPFVFIFIKVWNNYKQTEYVLRGLNKYSSYNKIICVMLDMNNSFKSGRKNMCSECGYKCCSKIALLIHILDHTDEEPFQLTHVIFIQVKY